MIVGMSGAGKSTLAKTVGKKLNLPVIHLDVVSFTSPSEKYAPEILKKKFDAIANQSEWVIDGNYFALTQAIRERAEFLVFMNFPPLYCVLYMIKRLLLHSLFIQRQHGVDVGYDGRNLLKDIIWVWRWPSTRKPMWLEEFHRLKIPVKIFHSRSEVQRWLETM